MDRFSSPRGCRPAPIARGLLVLGALLAAVALAAGTGCGKKSGHKKKKRVEPGVLFINEVSANATLDAPLAGAVLLDDAGQPVLDAGGSPADWIEIYNASPQAVQLDKATLSNDAARPELYRLPKMKLEPGEFVVVICDGQPQAGPLHAPFTLSTGEETVSLFTSNGAVELDRQHYRNLPENATAGRYPDGEVAWGLIYAGTPAAPNKPIGVQPPRVDGPAGLGPAGAGPDDPTPVTLVVREDLELLNATVEAREVSACGAGAGDFRGPFAMQIVPELSDEVIEARRDVEDEPIDVTVQRLTIFALLPHFDAGALVELRFRLENVVGVTSDEQCRAVTSGEPLLGFDDRAWVEPRCPTAQQGARVLTFLRVADATWADDSAAEPTLEVSMTYEAGVAGPVVIDRAGALVVEPASDCDRECYEPMETDGTTLLRVEGQVPPQPAGTLVRFAFAARDLRRDESAALADDAGAGPTSLRYLSGPAATLPLAINEVLTRPESTLAELYPDAVRQDPEFVPPQFAEIYNSGDDAIDIGGMYLALGAERSCVSEDCPADQVPHVREYRIPDGVVIPAKEFWVFLFTHADDRNTDPDLAGTILEGKTTVVRDVVRLDPCRGTLVLFSRDATGNCPLARLSWDCGAVEPPPDRSVGRLPDGGVDERVLDVPTPGGSNCVYEPLVALGDLGAEVIGPAGPDDCLRPESVVRLGADLRIAWRQVVLHPAKLGIEMIEIFIDLDGVAGPARPVDDFPNTVTRISAAGTPPCSEDVEIRVDVPAPAAGSADTVAYRMRVVDTAGGEVALGPATFSVCPAEPVFVRGDVDGDAHINVTDMVWINLIIFGFIPDPTCADAADVNDDGLLDMIDFFFLGDYIFRRGGLIPAPFPVAGPDPTADAIDCAIGRP